MMSYITAFDRVKYSRMLPVYLPDMIQMNDESPKISWFLLRGTFSIQKSWFMEQLKEMIIQESKNKSKVDLLA